MHVGARYYDAQVGRFLTRDTVLSEHPYLYCEHEPVNSVDPSGHIIVFIAGGIGAYLIIKSGIELIGNIQIIRGNHEAGSHMQQMVNQWTPKRDIDPDLIYQMQLQIRQWIIEADKEPGQGIIGSVFTTILGLVVPSITGQLNKMRNISR
jgi:hypothetical protein